MLRISKVSFPGLGIGEMTINSEAFSLFGYPIAWYAIIITLGMIAAVAYVICKSKKIGITYEDVLDYALFVIPIGVIGARLYYVLTKLEEFPTFQSWFDIRGGGLAIYGGIIAGGLTVLVVSYFKKINFLAFADCVAPGVLLAQGIGRWGNFMNGEAFGYETDWFCRMELQNSLTGIFPKCVHPTFLYESLWNFLGVFLINLYAKHKKYDGQIFLMIFCWYGFGRMFIEGLRTDSLYTTIMGVSFRTSQILAIIIFIVTAAILIFFRIKRPVGPLYYRVKKENKSKK